MRRIILISLISLAFSVDTMINLQDLGDELTLGLPQELNPGEKFLEADPLNLIGSEGEGGFFLFDFPPLPIFQSFFDLLPRLDEMMTQDSQGGFIEIETITTSDGQTQTTVTKNLRRSGEDPVTTKEVITNGNKQAPGLSEDFKLFERKPSSIFSTDTYSNPFKSEPIVPELDEIIGKLEEIEKDLGINLDQANELFEETKELFDEIKVYDLSNQTLEKDSNTLSADAQLYQYYVEDITNDIKVENSGVNQSDNLNQSGDQIKNESEALQERVEEVELAQTQTLQPNKPSFLAQVETKHVVALSSVALILLSLIVYKLKKQQD